MKKENLEKSLKSNDHTMNILALEFLLQNGRVNLLDDEKFNQYLQKIEDEYNSGKGKFLMDKNYSLEVVKSSRKMALMEAKDLYDFIGREICIIEDVKQEIEEETSSPDYDY